MARDGRIQGWRRPLALAGNGLSLTLLVLMVAALLVYLGCTAISTFTSLTDFTFMWQIRRAVALVRDVVALLALLVGIVELVAAQTAGQRRAGLWLVLAAVVGLAWSWVYLLVVGPGGGGLALAALLRPLDMFIGLLKVFLAWWAWRRHDELLVRTR